MKCFELGSQKRKDIEGGPSLPSQPPLALYRLKCPSARGDPTTAPLDLEPTISYGKMPQDLSS